VVVAHVLEPACPGHAVIEPSTAHSVWFVDVTVQQSRTLQYGVPHTPVPSHVGKIVNGSVGVHAVSLATGEYALVLVAD
jgi:hypothetical protein